MTTPLTHRALIAPVFLPEQDEGAEGAEGAKEGAAGPAEALADNGEPLPPGLPLAELLEQGLCARGWRIPYRWATYTGHAFDARRGEQRYDVELALLDTEADAGRGAWLIVAKRRTGLFRRLFKSETDPAEHALLRHDIDAALAADPRTAEGLRPWVTEADWLASHP